MKVWWNIFLEKYRTWNKQEQYLILSGSTWSFSFNKLKIFFFFFWKSFKMVLSRGHMCIRSDDQLWYYQMSVRSDWRPLSPRLPQNQACRSKVSTGLRWDPLTQSVWWTQQHRTSFGQSSSIHSLPVWEAANWINVILEYFVVQGCLFWILFPGDSSMINS